MQNCLYYIFEILTLDGTSLIICLNFIFEFYFRFSVWGHLKFLNAKQQGESEGKEANCQMLKLVVIMTDSVIEIPSDCTSLGLLTVEIFYLNWIRIEKAAIFQQQVVYYSFWKIMWLGNGHLVFIHANNTVMYPTIGTCSSESDFLTSNVSNTYLVVGLCLYCVFPTDFE